MFGGLVILAPQAQYPEAVGNLFQRLMVGTVNSHFLLIDGIEVCARDIVDFVEVGIDRVGMVNRVFQILDYTGSKIGTDQLNAPADTQNRLVLLNSPVDNCQLYSVQILVHIVTAGVFFPIQSRADVRDAARNNQVVGPLHIFGLHGDPHIHIVCGEVALRIKGGMDVVAWERLR